MKVCQWCRAPLTWSAEKGWVHPDGKMYVSHEEKRPCSVCKGERGRTRTCLYCKGLGWTRVTVDDHCAMPVDP